MRRSAGISTDVRPAGLLFQSSFIRAYMAFILAAWLRPTFPFDSSPAPAAAIFTISVSDK